jgi:hypothetical protein
MGHIPYKEHTWFFGQLDWRYSMSMGYRTYMGHIPYKEHTWFFGQLDWRYSMSMGYRTYMGHIPYKEHTWFWTVSLEVLNGNGIPDIYGTYTI